MFNLQAGRPTQLCGGVRRAASSRGKLLLTLAQVRRTLVSTRTAAAGFPRTRRDQRPPLVCIKPKPTPSRSQSLDRQWSSILVAVCRFVVGMPTRPLRRGCARLHARSGPESSISRGVCTGFHKHGCRMPGRPETVATLPPTRASKGRTKNAAGRIFTTSLTRRFGLRDGRKFIRDDPNRCHLFSFAARDGPHVAGCSAPRMLH